MSGVDYTTIPASDLFDLLYLGSENEEQVRLIAELRGRFLVQASLISEGRKEIARLLADLAEADQSVKDALAVLSELRS